MGYVEQFALKEGLQTSQRRPCKTSKSELAMQKGSKHVSTTDKW
jgi:hypothetical protein